MNNPSKAFTLIELLIVVLIIAILAAIAVPNFLEFQVRAKISRAKSDMRSQATAVEAYFVDWNTYIPSAHDDMAPKHGEGGLDAQTPRGWWRGYFDLTTPIAYMSSLPNDPFNPFNDELNGLAYYSLYSGNNKEAMGGVRQIWVMVSYGPARENTVGRVLAGSQGYWTDRGWMLDISNNADSTSGLPYDPTNGTVSAGNIFRFPGGGDGNITTGAANESFLRYTIDMRVSGAQ